MSEKFDGCYVKFKQDLRSEDAERVANAIRMIKNVEAVEFSDFVTDLDDWRARQAIGNDAVNFLMFAMRYIINRDAAYCFDKDGTLTTLREMIKILEDKK